MPGSASGRAPPFARLQYQLYAFAANAVFAVKQKIKQTAAIILNFFILKNPFLRVFKKSFCAHSGIYTEKLLFFAPYCSKT
jgi:hypothetical protein